MSGPQGTTEPGTTGPATTDRRTDPARPPRQRKPPPKPPTREERRRKVLGDLAAVLVVLLGIAAMVFAATYVARNVVSNSVEDQAERMMTPTSCGLVSDQEVSEAIGRPMKALKVTSGLGLGLGQGAVDSRLLPDVAASCLAVSDGDAPGAAVRIAMTAGNDAGTRYDGSRRAAQDGGFLGAPLPGLGDAAFCTTPDASGGSGVFAREAEKVVYVSLSEGADACLVARDLARAVLAG